MQPEQVFVGNGSDEVIALAFMALLKHSCRCISRHQLQLLSGVVRALRYRLRDSAGGEDFSIDPAAYPANNGGIIIPNPNAPTGC